MITLVTAAPIEIIAHVIPVHSSARGHSREVVRAHEREQPAICQAASATHMAVDSWGEGFPDAAMENAMDAMVTAKNTKANTARSALSVAVGIASGASTGAG